MYTTTRLFSLLFTFLSVLSIIVDGAPGASEKSGLADLRIRQQAQPVPISNEARCLDYSNTANLAAVSSNSTYRTAFLQLSPQGTNKNRVMLNTAQIALPTLAADVSLNQQCGNLTERAFSDAALNFTRGEVLGLTGVNTLDSPPGKVQGAGMSLLIIVAACIGFTAGLWVIMP